MKLTNLSRQFRRLTQKAFWARTPAVVATTLTFMSTVELELTFVAKKLA